MAWLWGALYHPSIALALDSAHHEPSIWPRYFDNTFVVWPLGPEQLQNLVLVTKVYKTISTHTLANISTSTLTICSMGKYVSFRGFTIELPPYV
jgi:hypothetical protein